MTAAQPPNPRASLLAGLRTGGVRSVSVPHTAGPTGSFNTPVMPSHQTHHVYPEEEELDGLADVFSHNMHVRNPRDLPNMRQPRTASFDASGARLSQQQQQQQQLLLQAQLAQHSVAPGWRPNVTQHTDLANQAQLQLQMIQMEMLRFQAMAQMQQIAQLQAESVPSHRQYTNRVKSAYEPATAGPRTQTFGEMRTDTMGPLSQLQVRQTEQNHEQFAEDGNIAVPMTAALGGRFGGRVVSENSHLQQGPYRYVHQHTNNRSMAFPVNSHTVATGGGSINSFANGNSLPPSKSDSAVTWRRLSSVAPAPGPNGSRTSSVSPTTRTSALSSDSEQVSPLPLGGVAKSRPEPLHFSQAVTPLLTVALSSGEDSELGDDSSSSKSDTELSSSSPTTPLSGNSNTTSTSAREEASKKLFQGLGIGRPSIHVTAPNEIPWSAPPVRSVSQPIRQPKGPPGAVDELGDRNFANRIRKRAIGGLGALLEARGRRDGHLELEAF